MTINLEEFTAEKARAEDLQRREEEAEAVASAARSDLEQTEGRKLELDTLITERAVQEKEVAAQLEDKTAELECTYDILYDDGENEVGVSEGLIKFLDGGPPSENRVDDSLALTLRLRKAEGTGVTLHGASLAVSATDLVTVGEDNAEGGVVRMTDAKSEGTVDMRVDGGVRVTPESARVQDVDFVYGLKTGLKFTFEETSLSHIRRVSLEVAHAYRLGKYEQILVGIRWVHIYSRYCTSG